MAALRHLEFFNMQIFTFHMDCNDNLHVPEVPIHAPLVEVFREYDPLKVVSYHLDPQKAHPWPERRLTYRS